MTSKRDLQIREFDSFQDLVIALIELQDVKTGFERNQLEPPGWLVMKIQEGQIEVQARVRVQKERKLIELRLKREGLKTPDEKRDAVEKQIAALEAELSPV